MCSSSLKDFDEWKDLNRLRKEVEEQKARVESLQSEQSWIKSSYSATDIYNKTRLDRSDSGIDRQSLFMETKKQYGYDSSGSLSNQECPTGNIKKVIEITSLIRAIEQQLNLSKNYLDIGEMNPAFNSMRRHFCEQADIYPTNDSWIHNQLISSVIEQERLNKQLSQLHNQLYRIENLKIPTLLNGISNDQLKKKIEEYYKLKNRLAELASNVSCSSSAIITVVKKLELLGQTVEQYLMLNQEIQNIQKQIYSIIQRRNVMQNKRSQLSKMVQLSANHKSKPDHLPQSASWDPPSHNDLNIDLFDKVPYQKPQIPFGFVNNVFTRELTPVSNSSNGSNVGKETPKNNFWLPFNGDGILEEFPPTYDEYLQSQCEKKPEHSRNLCHEYVNQEVIGSREAQNNVSSIELMLSSFPVESIIIIQVISFTVQFPLCYGKQYRARIQQVSGDGSDWNSIYVNEEGTKVFVSPHILLPIKWSFTNQANISFLLEIQLHDKGSQCFTNCYICSFAPNKSAQHMVLPMHHVHNSISNVDISTETLCTSFPDYPIDGSFKVRSSVPLTVDDGFLNLVPEIHISRNIKSNSGSPQIHYSNIRRSQTYSHDHQYCGNMECCSSIDCVSEPTPKMTPRFLSQNVMSSQRRRSSDSEENSLFESGCISLNSSFKRQSPFRQPIRLKKNSCARDIAKEHTFETTEYSYNDNLIGELWSLVIDLHMAVNACSNHDEKLLEFAYFKTRCPSNLLKLYEYFVETIFNSDQ